MMRPGEAPRVDYGNRSFASFSVFPVLSVVRQPN
jgi:hypothetical protein